MSAIGVGTRVEIFDPNAPFFGSTGEVTGRGSGMSEGPHSVWMVRVDGFKLSTACYEKELAALAPESALKRTTPECTCPVVYMRSAHDADCPVLRPPTPEGGER